MLFAACLHQWFTWLSSPAAVLRPLYLCRCALSQVFLTLVSSPSLELRRRSLLHLALSCWQHPTTEVQLLEVTYSCVWSPPWCKSCLVWCQRCGCPTPWTEEAQVVWQLLAPPAFLDALHPPRPALRKVFPRMAVVTLSCVCSRRGLWVRRLHFHTHRGSSGAPQGLGSGTAYPVGVQRVISAEPHLATTSLVTELTFPYHRCREERAFRKGRLSSGK